MTDELDDLKNAFDTATPSPNAARKAENIALAEKNFTDLQGSRDRLRPTIQKGPIGAVLNGVGHMWNVLTTKGALTASTALVAVGLVVVLPGGPFQQPNGSEIVSPTEPELDRGEITSSEPPPNDFFS